MRQLPSPKPFVSYMMPMPGTGLSGRWANLLDGQDIAQVAKRRAGGKLTFPAKLNLNSARAIIHLLEGDAELRYYNGNTEETILAHLRTPDETMLYRLVSNMIYTTASFSQGGESAVLFAARLLINKTPDLAEAYLALLQGLANPLRDQKELDDLMATTCDELMVALAEDLELEKHDNTTDFVNWFNSVSLDRDAKVLDELKATGTLDLKDLFAEVTIFEKYLHTADPTKYDILKKVRKAVADEDGSISSKSFIGPQVGICLTYMRLGKHILYHGPTGTGKTFAWDLAMQAFDPEFDANQYPYFVQGSGGLEDIDFTGQAILKEDGTRGWVYGPLSRAMMDGKRFKCEELNRLPGSMLNVLLGAMDYGRIYIPALGKMIVAAPGFAVDAMANIGREYTATEELDPAIMRRFQIKVEFDFLEPKDEQRLLRSRYPKVTKLQAEQMVNMANDVRMAFEQGNGQMDVDLYVSPAALLNCAELVAAGKEILDAVRLTWLADVAWTKAKRESLIGALELRLVTDKKAKVMRPNG
jgi:MoxR-like ATPase